VINAAGILLPQGVGGYFIAIELRSMVLTLGKAQTCLAFLLA